MADYFLETSALVKRYVQEAGTGWVRALAAPAAGHNLYIAHITGVETISALTLRLRRGSMAAADAAAAIGDFRQDFSTQYAIFQITPAVIHQAMRIAEKYALRGYDAVQLACAWEAQQDRITYLLPSLVLVSADSDLNAAAAAEGLVVDDPNTHL